MNISYLRDYRHNNLVIRDNRVLDDDYQLKMLWKNEIEGMIPCKERMINGEGMLCYDVTSKQSLAVIFDNRPLKFEDVLTLFKRLKKTSDRLADYILFPDKLILQPEYIFADIEAREYEFIYYPYLDDPNSFSLLIGFLMERADPDDVEATEMIYKMADMTGRQYYSLNEALSYILNEYDEQENRDAESRFSGESANETNGRQDGRAEKGFDNTEGNDYTKLECIDSRKNRNSNKRKESLWNRIRRFFFEKEIPEQPAYYEWNENDDLKENNTGDETVFIPWTENCENKLYGSGKGNKYHIDLVKTPITVGKMTGAVDMVIPDGSLSRMHAKFIRTQNRYYMVDLNSTNGCFINGRRLAPNEQVQIEAGDEIGLGKLKFIYR